jgi:ATP adenylyltransferase
LAEKTQALYGLLLDAAGIAPIRLDRAVRASRPYNLLVTRDWVMLVPRSRERFETISINALAFTGSLFIRNREELQVLETSRPASVLKAVTAC